MSLDLVISVCSVCIHCYSTTSCIYCSYDNYVSCCLRDLSNQGLTTTDLVLAALEAEYAAGNCPPDQIKRL